MKGICPNCEKETTLEQVVRSEFSHKENGYLDTENARLISYEYAEFMDLEA